jgi:hypothetical protein
VDEEVPAVDQPPGRGLDPRERAVDAPVDLLGGRDGDGQEVVGEEGFEDAEQRPGHHVAEEVAPEDDAGGRGGDGPAGDGAADRADEDGLRRGHKLRQYVDPVPERILQEWQPDAVRLVPPHGDVEPEHGDHQERARGVAARKRPVVHLHRHEVVAVVHRARPAHDLLDDGHEDQIKHERHEQVEEEHPHLGRELRPRRHERRRRARDEEHAVSRKLQRAQKHVKEDPQSVLVHPRRKLPIKLHNVVKQAQIRTRRGRSDIIVLTVYNFRLHNSRSLPRRWRL